jgi:hypothetical protein
MSLILKKIESFIELYSNNNFNIKNEWEEFNMILHCQYKFVRGLKKDSLCGKIIKEGEFCCLHKEKYNHKNKEKNIEEKKSISNEKKIPQIEKIIIVVLNKNIGKFVHKPTKLIFYSKEKQVVYARIKDEKIYPLRSCDIEICKQYNFNYDIELLKVI